MKPPRPSPLVLLPLACLIISGPLPAHRDVEVVGAAPDARAEAERLMLEGLEALWYGTPEERLEAAAQASYLFRPVCTARAARDDDPGAAVVDSLARYLRVESDDWISTRLLRDLAGTGWCPPLHRLFRDALLSPSPNVRRQAARWFAGNFDEAAARSLEDLWRRDPPAWMRPDLLRALALHDRAGDLRDLVRLSEGDDLDLALAAVEAIAVSDDPRAVEALAAIAGRGPVPLRIEAVLALADWEDEPRALEALLGTSRAGPRLVRLAALAALVDFEEPAAVERLIEVVRDPSDTEARALASQALAEAEEHPDAAPALVDILRQPRSEETESLRHTALCALEEIDDASVLPDLIALPHNPADPTDPLAALIASLGGQEGTVEGCFTPDLPDLFLAGDREDPRTLCVLPPGGMDTTRCWLRPGVAGGPERYPRLPADWPALPEDYFERDGDLWVLVDGLVKSECWVPRLHLEQCPPGAWLPTAEILRLARREFDLPTALLQTDPLRVLVENGLLVPIDPSDDVTGVALTFEPEMSLWEVMTALPMHHDQPPPDADAIARAEALLRRYRDEPLMGPPASTRIESGADRDDRTGMP